MRTAPLWAPAMFYMLTNRTQTTGHYSHLWQELGWEEGRRMGATRVQPAHNEAALTPPPLGITLFHCASPNVHKGLLIGGRGLRACTHVVFVEGEMEGGQPIKARKWDLNYCAIIKPRQTPWLPQDVVKDNELRAQVAAEVHSNL